ncbi:MAG: DUF3108 domain-containing protein, partial [Candidatus Omnitrophota bacterium]
LFAKGHLTVGRYSSVGLPEISKSSSESFGETSELHFNYGEKFTYLYTMGPLRAGSAELTFLGKAAISGSQAYLIRFESRVGTFYDLENIYAETENFYPVYIERKIKKFGIKTNIKERYDRKNYKVEIVKGGFFGKKTEVIKKQSPIHNSILLIYYCRRLSSSELKPGYEFDVVLPTDEFKVTLTRIEKIKVPAGNFQAYLFESNPERIRLWVATDKRRTPLKMENLTSFGPSSIVLEKYWHKDTEE